MSRSVPIFMRRPRASDERARRVCVLLAGVLVLSIADLALTVGYLRTTGMIEANPIAAYLIRSTGSAWALGAYKALSAGVCIALLHRLRRHVQGEVAAWFALIVLAGMSVMWRAYSDAIDSPAQVQTARAQHEGQWLMLN